MKIALDAMGGDFAPEQIVAGGVQAHRELGVEVIFVGIKDRVDAALATSGAGKWAQIEEAPEAIARSEEHTSELQSLAYLVCRLLREKNKMPIPNTAL